MFTRLTGLSALVFFAGMLFASVFGTVRVIVHDPQHRAITNATVTLQGAAASTQTAQTDSAGVAQIRKHLREIAAAFKKGDFSIPAFVHQQSVPGTAVMAKKRDVITYTERDLPRGGEVRITTKDPEAIAAIHEFMAFQRHDHHAGGMGAMKMPERR